MITITAIIPPITFFDGAKRLRPEGFLAGGFLGGADPSSVSWFSSENTAKGNLQAASFLLLTGLLSGTGMSGSFVPVQRGTSGYRRFGGSGATLAIVSAVQQLRSAPVTEDRTRRHLLPH
jgi:hypothetical protein